MSRQSWANATAAAITVLTIGSTVVAIVVLTLDFGAGPAVAPSPLHQIGDRIGWAATLTLYLALTVVLLLRRPDNRIPWLLAVFVGVTALGQLADAARVAVDPQSVAGALSEWYGQWWFAAMVGCLLLLFHLFPTGHFVTGRWRWGSYSAVVAVCVIPTLMTDSLSSSTRRAVQLGVPDWLHEVFVALTAVTWVVALLAIVPVLTVRLRQSTSAQRQQVKWFIFAVSAALAVWFFLEPRWGLFGHVSIALPGVGIAVAMLRYRLYDIDRLISRTLSYAIVSLLVLVIYASVVLTASRVVAANSTLVTAGATLAAAALARPLLRRVQDVVDRRFDRSRYNAELAVEQFGARLRSEVDLDQVQALLLATVDRTLQPTTLRLLGVESR